MADLYWGSSGLSHFIITRWASSTTVRCLQPLSLKSINPNSALAVQYSYRNCRINAIKNDLSVSSPTYERFMTHGFSNSSLQGVEYMVFSISPFQPRFKLSIRVLRQAFILRSTRSSYCRLAITSFTARLILFNVGGSVLPNTGSLVNQSVVLFWYTV